MGSDIGKHHVPLVMGLNVSGGVCSWVPDAGNLTEARTSGCATKYGSSVIFAGGHNNDGSYVGTVDVLDRNGDGTVRVSRTLELPLGRELLGCASALDVTVFAGGKPPHPPAPYGETDEVDIWNHTTDEWSTKRLSVERKKVEAMAVGTEILMAGGEIGHHDPSANGYSSSVDILDLATGEMRVENLSLARQYFAIAAAGGKAFFAGGFANFGSDANAGYRSNVVDVYDSKTKAWSVMRLAQNRSNFVGTAVLDRWVLFAGGTMQQAEPDLCNATGRSAVVDIYDTLRDEWSTSCLSEGRTTTSISVGPSFGSTAVFFGDTIDLFTFDAATLV